MDSDKILKEFNLGYLISFDWKSAICPCGTLLNKNDQSGICVACGTVYIFFMSHLLNYKINI
jgi:hypothetical protein